MISYPGMYLSGQFLTDLRNPKELSVARNRRLIALSIIFAMALLSWASPQADAQTSTTMVTGTVVDAITSLPLPNVRVRLFHGDARIADGTTGTDGSFRFPIGEAGIYAVSIDAGGYQQQRSEDVPVVLGTNTNIRVSAIRDQTGNQEPRTIGRVSSATRSNMQIASTVSRNLSADSVQREAILRVGDALQTLPGITAKGLDSSPGDDLFISLRGTRSSETQALIDGHPTGPLGVANGSRGAYDYQISPSFALKNVQVTYGTGGSNLYGVDAIGGTVDFQTIDPTPGKPTVTLRQGLGNLGRQTTFGSLTGTSNRLGYVLLGGVEGTYGGFPPQTIVQSGNFGNNLTAKNVAANTWLVNGAFNLRQDLAKLRYALSPVTSVQATAYVATDFDDKTGNGDNVFNTPDFVLANAQLNAKPTAACPSGLMVKTDANANQCVTGPQYAALNSGPSGGSPLAFQTILNQDYSVRATTSVGRATAVAELFRDNVYVVYDRNNAGFTFKYLTNGARGSIDFTGTNNTFGLGAFTAQQTFQQGGFGATGVTTTPANGDGTQTFFVRDVYNALPRLTVYFNGNEKHELPSGTTSFDPRLAVTYGVTNQDVVRIASGRASDRPNIGLTTGVPTFYNTPGRVGAVCGGLSIVGSGPNAQLTSEKATDLEVGYSHRFFGDTSINLTAYDEEEQNAIFSSTVPLSSSPIQPPAALLAQYLAKVNGVCQNNATIANLGFTATANAGAGRFRGIEVSGRVRFTPAIFADYSYNVTSSRLFNIPLSAQKRDVTVIDGGQVLGVPYQTANLGVSYAPRTGLQFRMDGNFVGSNNGLSRPPYVFANNSIGYRHGATLFNLGISNTFNSQYDQYGRTGVGVFRPENQFGTDKTPLQQAVSGVNGSTRAGLTPRALVLSVQQRF